MNSYRKYAISRAFSGTVKPRYTEGLGGHQ